MTYAERERATLRDLALRTALDPTASPEDQAAARRRLAIDAGADLGALSLDELRTLRALLQRAYGLQGASGGKGAP